MVDANANLKDIFIDRFAVSVQRKELLKNSSLKVFHGRRYALVGPNARGKSGLLKFLAWRQVPFPQNLNILLLEQDIVIDDQSPLEVVVFANKELIKLKKEATTLLDETYDDYAKKLAMIYEKLQLLGSDYAEAYASKIFAGLGFTKAMQARPTKSFSGGWKMRLTLARSLFIQPTLLLLDEPTNHLDLHAIFFYMEEDLKKYLLTWKRPLVMVAHDQEFFNSICTDNIHFHDEKLYLYKGTFDAINVAYEQKMNKSKKASEIYKKQMKTCNHNGRKKDW
ncbi:hypothetical protein L7F22_026181 [Adiantum nelumboides]|nr:hypothetical protein [Adiantum nelumboides]